MWINLFLLFKTVWILFTTFFTGKKFKIIYIRIKIISSVNLHWNVYIKCRRAILIYIDFLGVKFLINNFFYSQLIVKLLLESNKV